MLKKIRVKNKMSEGGYKSYWDNLSDKIGWDSVKDGDVKRLELNLMFVMWSLMKEYDSELGENECLKDLLFDEDGNSRDGVFSEWLSNYFLSDNISYDVRMMLLELLKSSIGIKYWLNKNGVNYGVSK